MQTFEPLAFYQVLEKEYEDLNGTLSEKYKNQKEQIEKKGDRLSQAIIDGDEEVKAATNRLAKAQGSATEKLRQWQLKKAHSLTEERQAEKLKEAKKRINQEHLANLYAEIHDWKPAALCLSGGGIRSATFALGLFQGLARRDLLGRFHYLSTVSGGGYIGSWLTGWIHRHLEGEQGVMEDLKSFRGRSDFVLDHEAKEIQHLREYSNYLTPKLGLLSADTWAAVAIYLRNLILNLLVLLPLLAAVLMLPRFLASMTRYYNDTPQFNSTIANLMLGVGFVFGVFALLFIGLNRPSGGDRGDTQRDFWWYCLLPLSLSALLLIAVWAWYIGSGKPFFGPWPFIIAGVILALSSYMLWMTIQLWKKYVAKHSIEINLKPLFGEPAVAVVIGVLSGWLIYLLSKSSLFFESFGEELAIHVTTYASFAFALLLLVFLFSTFLFVGGISFWTRDEDREWWSRSDAWILIAILVWAGISAVVIYGPLGFGYTLSVVGGISGLVTVILGKNAGTMATKSSAAKGASSSFLQEKTLSLAAPLFALFIVVMLSLGTTELIKLYNNSDLNAWLRVQAPALSVQLAKAKTEGQEPPESRTLIDLPPWQITAQQASEDQANKTSDWRHYDYLEHLNTIQNTPPLVTLILLLIFAGLSLLLSLFVNINKFSMQSLYGNRLTRAYIGASNRERKPNPFSGFDPSDNLQMSKLWPNTAKNKTRRQLFPVINMALNLVSGKKLAWQQRKAESFTVTPLHCGSQDVGYIETEKYGGPTGGIKLGQAVAISGAAVSPNMGYHSSPLVAFILTLFNVRLGGWLGNPSRATEKKLQRSGPSFALKPLIAETFGLTNSEHTYLYLSDGGHFENLAFYEMVRRRCHLIVVSDGGQDNDCKLEDLGNAIRKVRIDFGVPIEFVEEKVLIFPRSEDQERNNTGTYYALAKIRYSQMDRANENDRDNLYDGWLIYIKPAFYGKEPVDICEYARSNVQFPHETTADQFFSESQFESYRMLGAHVANKLFDDTNFKTPLDLLKQQTDKNPTPR